MLYWYYYEKQRGEKMNEIVKYDNYMNSLKFTGFTTTDFNFLMMLCSKLRDKDTSKIIISFAELRQKTGYTQRPVKQFVSDLERMNDKLMKVTCKLRTKTEIIMFVLFPTFRIDLDKQILTVAVNEEFKFILNELIKNFTRFDLDEFIKLDSKYSKNLYRLLKQYKSTGYYEVTLEDFRNKMEVPESYTTRDITRKVVSMALKELQNYFENLECTVKYARKKGTPVTGYIFTFVPEEKIHNGEIEQKGQKSNSKTEKSRNKIKNSRFNNIESRNYDYEDLEKQLIVNHDRKGIANSEE